MANFSAYLSAADRHIKNRVVLVAHSNPYLRSIIRTILLQLGVKATREAADGFEAIDAVCTFDPWALILDWGIRGMDAREVVRVVRTSGVVPDAKLPVVGISDPIMRSKVVQAKDLGIDYLLLTPISPKLLQERLVPTLVKLVQSLSPPDANASPTANAISLLTPERTAEILEVSAPWLSRARKKGYGPPHILLGSKVRYAEASLVEWIKSREEKGTNKSTQRRSSRQPSSRTAP